MNWFTSFTKSQYKDAYRCARLLINYRSERVYVVNALEKEIRAIMNDRYGIPIATAALASYENRHTKDRHMEGFHAYLSVFIVGDRN